MVTGNKQDPDRQQAVGLGLFVWLVVDGWC
jgi:hypothetical protein